MVRGRRGADNLARTLVKLGKIADAVALLAADESPQKHGNRLLARQLQAQVEASEADTETAAAGEE